MDLLKELLTLNERYADWSILPATMTLYNRRTVDIVTAASEWKDQVIKAKQKIPGVTMNKSAYLRSNQIMKRNKTIHSLRIVASFSLLGAVVAGALLGWVDTSVDFRAVGAIAGATVPFVLHLIHFA